MSSPPDIDLDTLAHRCWRDLARGARIAGHAWHTPVVATLSASGPEARTVVLRAADEDRRALVLHTDRRSGKAAELGQDKRLTWVFWDPRKRIQLRCKGTVSCHAGNDMARSAWDRLGTHSRALYGSRQAPGAPLTAARNGEARGDGFENFLLVDCTVNEIDWLKLDRERHQRAMLRWSDDQWHAEAVAP